MMAAPFDDTFVADLLPAFVDEANEQVSAFEQLLLQLEDAPTDHELLDALFRCAHTVKGSAGLFGLDALVGFTHHVETVLDLLREGRLHLSPALSTVLLKSNDAIRDLVATATGHNAAALGAGGDEAARHRSALVAELQAASGHGAQAPGSSAVPPADAASPAVPRRCQATVRFGCETFRDGMDPLSMMAYLEHMDRCEDVVSPGRGDQPAR
jgi:two-component system, chemotaxis family, sensor kinase CheA